MPISEHMKGKHAFLITYINPRISPLLRACPSVIPSQRRNLKHFAFPNKFPIFAAHLWDFVPTNECNLLLNN